MIEYYTIAVIALLAAISPGPDFVVIVKNALSHNRTSAIFTSLGIGAGILVHATYCVLGLAVVISQSLLLFNIIKYLGAAYLIFLGVKSIFSKKPHLPKDVKKDPVQHSPWLSLRDGFLTNVLNPKCTLFMLSVFTLVVQPHTPASVQAIYGVEIALITVTWFVLLSVGLTYGGIKARLEKLQHVVSKLIGAVLIALGITVVFE